MLDFVKRQSPVRIIAFGFAAVILIGSLLLCLPFSLREGVEIDYIDALYTSTSAVCVTGLITVDSWDTFSFIGQAILLLLMEIGGLGVTCVGAGLILLMGRKMNLKGRNLVQEAMNLEGGWGVVRFVRGVFFTTVTIQLIGAAFSLIVFSQYYSLPRAMWMSVFHSVAAFNNSGFDLVGNMQNLIPFQDNVLLNLVTCALIFLGGIGFLVIREVIQKKFRWKKLSMHSRVVLSMSAFLIASGTLLIKMTENITWLGAFFASVTARTAGFSTFPFGEFTNAGLLVMIALMFIGASSGSTGGGIKTSTFFVLMQGIKSAATNKAEKAFHYAIPRNAFKKAATIFILAISVILISSFLLLVFEPELDFIDVLFEMTSAFATVGLSTGITPTLSIGSKLVSIVVMYIGRLGPLTVITLWHFTRGDRISYPEGNISIG